jgi:general secretion pathway protein H
VGRGAARGVTLVEMLIVIALIALIGGSILFGSGMLGGARQRAAGTLLITAVQKGIAQANTTGRPVRLVMDFAGNRIRLEESSTSKVLRSSPRDAAALEAAARRESERVVDTTTPPPPQYTAVDVLGDDAEPTKPTATEGEGEGAAAPTGPSRSLGAGVKFRLVQTEHDVDPITEGDAYLYFWPGGITEQAVIQLTRGADDEGLTVQVSSLTGRAVIKPGRVALPEPRSDGEYSEREEDL